jgi:hypothetical protein
MGIRRGRHGLDGTADAFSLSGIDWTLYTNQYQSKARTLLRYSPVSAELNKRPRQWSFTVAVTRIERSSREYLSFV